ncbi:LacI family DNA-binding transcriptional regulator [Bosea sp. NPDC055332]
MAVTLLAAPVGASNDLQTIAEIMFAVKQAMRLLEASFPISRCRMAPRKEPRRPNVTLKQVAERAGVHASTVSRALNADTRSMVVADVVARVEKAALELGYRRDPVAASLRTGRSKLIGVLVPDIVNPVFGPIVSGVSEVFAAQGFAVIIADAGNDEHRQIELAEGLVAHRVDGLILATVSRDDPLVDYCLSRRLPAVLVNRAEMRARLPAIISDDALGMQLAVDHLIELGHRVIGHLAGPSRHSTGYLRRRGFQLAVMSHDITLEAAPCEEASAYSREEGAAATHRLLDARPDLTAIASANDLLALGAYDALRERGLACPEDVSVIGHNDMPMLDLVSPPLTTVRISHKQMGRQAAQLLQAAIEGHDTPPHNIVLPSQLILRASTAGPRSLAEPVAASRRSSGKRR